MKVIPTFPWILKNTKRCGRYYYIYNLYQKVKKKSHLLFLSSTLSIEIPPTPTNLLLLHFNSQTTVLTATHWAPSSTCCFSFSPLPPFTVIVPSVQQGQCSFSISGAIPPPGFSQAHSLLAVIAPILWHRTPWSCMVKPSFSRGLGAQAANTHTSCIAIFTAPAWATLKNTWAGLFNK